MVDRSAAVARRYSGTVEYNGDGVMAIFGAPTALEDHAFRACLAAVAIQEEIGRMAADGDVVPSAVGTDRQIDVSTDYIARILDNWDGGTRALRVVWDPGNGAGAEVVTRLAPKLPGAQAVCCSSSSSRSRRTR